MGNGYAALTKSIQYTSVYGLLDFFLLEVHRFYASLLKSLKILKGSLISLKWGLGVLQFDLKDQ